MLTRSHSPCAGCHQAVRSRWTQALLLKINDWSSHLLLEITPNAILVNPTCGSPTRWMLDREQDLITPQENYFHTLQSSWGHYANTGIIRAWYGPVKIPRCTWEGLKSPGVGWTGEGAVAPMRCPVKRQWRRLGLKNRPHWTFILLFLKFTFTGHKAASETRTRACCISNCYACDIRNIPW